MVLMNFEDSCTCFVRVGYMVDLGVVCVSLYAWTILTRALYALCFQEHRLSFIFLCFFIFQLTEQSCYSFYSFQLAGASRFFFLFVWCVCFCPELIVIVIIIVIVTIYNYSYCYRIIIGMDIVVVIRVLPPRNYISLDQFQAFIQPRHGRILPLQRIY